MLPKLRQFLIVITGLIVAKLWHDTLPIFLDLYSAGGISRAVLSNYISCNSLGMTIGGVMAGMFTDSLSPRIVFPNAMLGILVSTACIILGFQFPMLKMWFADFIVSVAFYYVLVRVIDFFEKKKAIFIKVNLSIALTYILLSLFSNIIVSMPLLNLFLSNYFIALIANAYASRITFNYIGKALLIKLFYIVLFFIILSYIVLQDFIIQKIYFGKIFSQLTKFFVEGSPSLLPFYKLIPIDPNLIFFLVRGSLISASMNAAYVTVGDMYRGSSWLPIASAYLYTALFGSLASLPMIIKYTSKEVFLVLCIINLLLTIVLTRVVPKKEILQVDFLNYLRSILILARSKEFWLACSVTMVCIGNFYNIMYTFRDASTNGDLSENLIKLQSFGRYSTFAVGLVSTFSGIAFLTISNKNCAKFMYSGMGLVSVSMISLAFLFIFKKLGLVSEIIFYIICACSGICQPAAKASILSIAQSLGPSITGAGQSLTNFSYSLVEFIGSNIIFRLKYPFGAITYLLLAGILIILASIGLYLFKEKINSYISSDP